MTTPIDAADRELDHTHTDLLTTDNQAAETTAGTADTTADAADGSLLKVRSVGLVFAALIIAETIGSLDQTIIATALPTIVGELDGVDHMLWVTTCYVLASTIGMPIVGKLGDLIGRRGLFLGALVLFLIGSAMCGFTPSMTGLIIGRAIQGLGGGGMMVLSQAIVADIIPARKRALYLNAMGIAWAVPELLGPLLGGLFTEHLNWRWAFWINIPLTLLAITICALLLPKYPQHASLKHFDGLGLAAIAAAVTTLTLVTSWGGVQYAWNSPLIIALIVATVVLIGLFIAIEAHAAEPIMPLELFRNRNFVLTTVGGFIILFAMMASMSYLPTYFQLAHDMGPTAAGYMEVPSSVLYFVASLISGALVAKTGTYKKLMVVSFIISLAGSFGLCTLTATTSPMIACVYLAIMGFGMGLSFEILVLIVQNEFSASIVGTATSATNFFREIGTTLGASVAGAVFTGNLTRLLNERLAHLGGASALGTDVNSLTPSIVHALPTEVKTVVAESYNDALVPLFMIVVPLNLVAGIMMLMLDEKPLADTIEH